MASLASRRRHHGRVKKSLRKKTVRRGRKHTNKGRKSRVSRRRHTRKQRGGETVGDISKVCFIDCIEAAKGRTDGKTVWVPKTAPHNTVMRCLGECQPGQPLYNATAKKLNPEA